MSTSSHEGEGDWTIMLYIAADAVLANFAVESLKEFKKPASTPDGSKNAASALGKPNVEVNVIAGAHFAFPIDATKQASANAKASGKETKANRGEDLGADNTVPLLAPKLAGMLVEPAEKVSMSQRDALKSFLSKASEDPKFRAKHYALILWGHGPELLLQPAANDQTGSSRMYITPEDLREVLKPWIDVKLKGKDGGPKLDIIGFDACFMSMFEMACELEGLAEYMVASQDDVPDASFPYGKLVGLFREHGNDTRSLLIDGVDKYFDTYGEYIFGPSTGLNPVTLSVLQLDNCNALKVAVDGLASALLEARSEPGLPTALIEARKCSSDYASGLYVDLHGFCKNLDDLIKIKNIKDEKALVVGELKFKLDNEKRITNIKNACKKVAGALTLSSKRTPDKLILENRSADGKSHGISIYLPYLSDDQYAKVSWPLVKGGTLTTKGGTLTTKGGTLTTKGFSNMLDGAATEYLMCGRRSLILDTESYYQGLKLASPQDKSWYDFITNVWTKVLIETAPAELDFHYSAQQAWMNRCRRSIGK